MVAARKGQIDIVKLLIDAGAKLNLGNQQGDTALMLAENSGVGRK